MTTIATLFLLLTAGGCKKKEVEAAPAPKAEATDVKVFFPTVRSQGDTVHLTMEIHNETKNYLALELAEVRLFKGGEKVCAGKVPLNNKKLGAGLKETVSIEAPECPWSKHDGKVELKGTVIFETMGKDRKEFEFKPREVEVSK